MERYARANWKLVVAGLLLGVVLFIDLVLQLVTGMFGIFDVSHDENMLWYFWSRVGITDLLLLALLALALVPIARLAARGGARRWIFLLGGALGLAVQFAALQVAVSQHGKARESAIPGMVMDIVVVAVPILLVGLEWFNAHRERRARSINPAAGHP